MAELPFFVDFLKFYPALKRCEKGANSATDFLCLYQVVDGLYKDTVAFVDTDRTSTAAAKQRGLTGKCLDDLVFTPNQTRAMTQLAAGLHKFARDVMHTNVVGLQADAGLVDADVESAGKAMLISTTVTVCRHG